MRKIRFLSIFPVLFALALFFPGCKDDSTPEKPPATKYNGSLFVAKVPNQTNTYVYVSIYSTTTTNKMISPKSGETYSYATAVARFDEQDDIISGPDKKSEGKVTVGDNGSLTFKDAAGQTWNGTFTNEKLYIPGKVPGTTYGPFQPMDRSNSNIVATADKPFGTATLTPGYDDDDDDTPTPTTPTNPPNNPGAQPTYVQGTYKEGRIATRIAWIKLPDWGLKPTDTSSTTTFDTNGNSKYDSDKRWMYFEGDKVDFKNTGLKGRIYYSDGDYDEFDETNFYNYFVVEPPAFYLSSRFTTSVDSSKYWPVGQSSLLGSAFHYDEIKTNDDPEEYSFYFKDGLSNSAISPLSIISLPVTKWVLSEKFKGPPGGNIFPIREITYKSGTSSILEWLEDETRVFPTDPVKDVNNKDVIVSVKWWGNDNAAWGTAPANSYWQMNANGTMSITNANYSLQYEGRDRNYHNRGELDFKLSERSFKLADFVVNGSSDNLENATVLTPVTFNVAIGAWSVPFAASAYRKVEKIENAKEMAWNEQIIFDDDRLYNPQEKDVKTALNWLSKMKDGGIKVSYVDTKTTRTRTMQEAFDNAGLDFIKYNDGPFTAAKGSIGLKYYGKYMEGLAVPVFSNLKEIKIVNRPEHDQPFPILRSEVNDDLYAFLRKYVWVYATYEAGKGGPIVTRDDTYKQTQSENRSCVGFFDSNIDSNLKKATTNWNKGINGVPTKVTVGFNTGGVRKSYDTQIGATDY